MKGLDPPGSCSVHSQIEFDALVNQSLYIGLVNIVTCQGMRVGGISIEHEGYPAMVNHGHYCVILDAFCEFIIIEGFKFYFETIGPNTL